MALNGSSWNEKSKHTTYSEVRFVFSIFFMLTSFVGNSLVVYAIYRYRQLRTCSNLIILNLSLADVLLTIIVAPIKAFYWFHNQGTFSVANCFITGVLGYLLSLVSIYTLVFVSIERFIATNYPLKHRYMFTKKVVKVGIVIIWIWSAGFSALPFALSRYTYVEKFFHCMVDWPANQACTIIFLVFVYSLPVLTLIYCNVHILRAARAAHRSRARNGNSQNPENSNLKFNFPREHKASLIIVVIVAAFVLCWTPYTVGSILLGVYNLPKRFMSAAVLLPSGNAAINPVVYGVMNRNFYIAYRELLCPRNSQVRSI